ncbi:MAG: hypothetical protein FJY92_00915, partial [Candidatus Hydrogenedentes bacterium]|nr:hypothetical protein [Candidatus Hydrogenedentota bacterium]
AGGRIAVESRPGQGSTFAIHLPKSVTTQIINGFVVYSGGQPFVLPLESVIQTMRVPADEIESVTGRGRCVLRHGELLAVVSLQDALAGVRRPGVPAQDETLVAVRGQRGRYAVAVDSVLGVRKLVLKAIHGLSGQTGLVTGAALMGDGAIALVLGLEDLLASGPYSENSAAA